METESPSPRFLSIALPCPVRLRGNTFEVQSLGTAFYIFLFNSDWRSGLCPASVPPAASDTGAELSPEDSSIHSFSRYLHRASFGKVLSTPKSQCPHVSTITGKILPFTYLCPESTDVLWPIGHMVIWDFFFYPQGNEILRNCGTLIESSSWIQSLINEKRWISSYLLPKEEQVHLWQLSLLPGSPSPVGTLPKW